LARWHFKLPVHESTTNHVQPLVKKSELL
jgi:hypothetical protein